MLPTLDIQWMIRRNLQDVLEIERDCFEHAWSEEDFLCTLSQRNAIGMVAIDTRRDIIHGFVVYQLEGRRLTILNIAVSPESQRQGVGTQIIQRLKDKLDHQRREMIDALVRETNLRAQVFLRSMGFRAISVVRGHYDDTDESAYLMRFRIGERERQPVKLANRISEYLET